MIHKYCLNDCRIVLDIYSGAVHIVDDCAFEMLDFLAPPLTAFCSASVIRSLEPKYTEDAIRETYAELYSLYVDGTLFSEDTYESYADMLTAAPIKSMCINIAHDCNMRCGYCFAAMGDFGQGRCLMPLQTGKAAIDFLIKHSASRRNLEVDFFGGEPLMNFETVVDIVEYARSLEKEHGKNFRFTITTNGLLLNKDIIDFINREMANVVLSIDGRQDINDRLRIRADGSGTYEKVLPKYKELVASRGERDYYVRGTFTRYNMDFSHDVKHLADIGFDQISVEPVVVDESLPYSIRKQDLPAIYEEYETLALEILERKKRGEGINFFHFMLDLDQGPCAIRRLRGCSCGNEYIAVTPTGDIFPCHQFVGVEEMRMGNVHTGTIDREKQNFFAKTTVYHKKKCRDCWAKFYCSGGCNANNLLYQGGVCIPHDITCEIEKKRLECAIMIRAVLSEQT